jgi:prephenate dehydrogenase
LIQQITIVGTGLIGGSLALALKRQGFGGCIVGSDRAEVLSEAEARGVVDRGDTDAVRSCVGSQLVVLATPIGAIIDLIEKIGPLLPPDSLITDTGSTKTEIAIRAHQVFGEAAQRRFLPGHPIAGKEVGGIEHADADLFSSATWVLTPQGGSLAAVRPEFGGGMPGEFVRMLDGIGAQVVMLTPERHDRLCAYLSHLPQMLSTALAACVVDAIGEDGAREMLAGRAFREMTRVAASPYSMWRDIALTNTQNLSEVLLQLDQKLAHIRENLRTRALQEEFDRAHELFAPPMPKDDFDPPKF